ncbi:MAG: EAL domain-containing protein [Christensenellales bacterium]
MTQGMDELTGLSDQVGFESAAEALLRQGDGQGFCLIYWNIRQLRIINDLLGRQAGDEALADFAQRLLAGPLSLGQGNYKYSVCCGLYRIEQPEASVRMMIDMAGMAMGRARGNYAAPYAWFEASMWEAAVKEHQLNADFAEALRAGQFEVYYQPICRGTDGRIQGCEALVRWNHPARGLLLPGQFMSQFERNGFIGMLDRYVWDAVCGVLGRRLARGEVVVPVAINVSRLAFYDARAFEDLLAITQKHRVPPKYLRVEITESAYAGDPAPVCAAIERLHELGFMVLMDDFGSGYSSMGTLKDYPVDVLKVDKVFLQQLDSSPKGQVILETVVRMAKWMHLRVIVEGVETRAQWDYLRSIECDLVQGYFFHRPMPEAAFAALLERQGTEDPTRTDPLEPADGDMELSRLLLQAFTLGHTHANAVFFEMIGGMAVLTLKGERLSTLQLNKTAFQLFFPNERVPGEGFFRYRHEVLPPYLDALADGCRRSFLQRQRVQIQAYDGERWLQMQVQYSGSMGDRQVFYCTLAPETLDDVPEQLRCAFWRSILDQLHDGVYFVDADRRIQYWNPAAERITGYRAEDILGKRCQDTPLNHIDGQGRPLCQLSCPLFAAMVDGQIHRDRVLARHREGYRIPLRVTILP